MRIFCDGSNYLESCSLPENSTLKWTKCISSKEKRTSARSAASNTDKLSLSGEMKTIVLPEYWVSVMEMAYKQSSGKPLELKKISVYLTNSDENVIHTFVVSPVIVPWRLVHWNAFYFFEFHELVLITNSFFLIFFVYEVVLWEWPSFESTHSSEWKAIYRYKTNSNWKNKNCYRGSRKVYSGTIRFWVRPMSLEVKSWIQLFGTRGEIRQSYCDKIVAVW